MGRDLGFEQIRMATVASRCCSVCMTSSLKETLSVALTKAPSLAQALSKCRGTAVATLMTDIVQRLKTGENVERQAYLALKEVSWEKLHTGHWCEVQEAWRDAYAFAQLLSVSAQLQDNPEAAPDAALFKDLDLALVMGANLFREEIDGLLRELGHAKKRKRCISQPAPKKSRSCQTLPWRSLERPAGQSPAIETGPSLEEFSEKYLRLDGASEPCILKGLALQWPAFQKWPDLNYFHDRYGFRTVPVEIGRHYLADKWSQAMMPLTDFLEKHLSAETSPEGKGYLAQHPLFDQIPELKEDICVPEYCFLSSDEKEPQIHAWFGPEGTVSPLHFDRSHNILAQVMGRKYIRLYAPCHSAALHPIPTFMNKNSSQIDLDDTAQSKTYGIESLPFVDCLLEPGDGLFIPKGWWHYVRALDLSFSVSFWWNGS